jgi:hypothetical protein
LLWSSIELPIGVPSEDMLQPPLKLNRRIPQSLKNERIKVTMSYRFGIYCQKEGNLIFA